MRIVLLVLLIHLVISLNVRQCDPKTCKGVASECIESGKCAKQLTQCVLAFNTNIDEGAAYTEFEACMDQVGAAGKLMSCAKIQCPSSAAEFVSMVFDSI